MAQFLFQAKAIDGKMIKGTVEASNENEARIKIRAQQMIPLKVVPQEQKSKAGQAKKKKGKVKSKELQVFTRQFAVLIGAGVPVVQSLEAMLGGGKTPAMSTALESIVTDLGQGRRLYESLAQEGHIFDRMYVNLVRAGEEGGVLEEVLNRLAAYIEKANKLRGKILGALWYPAAVIIVSILVISGILMFVIPSFVEMFEGSGQDLPELTQMVIAMSEYLQTSWYIPLGVVVALFYGLKLYKQTEAGRQNIDKVLIDTPLFGMLIQKGAIARFSRTLATLLSAGVRVLDALDIAGSTAGNSVIENTLVMAKDSISKGRSISDPLNSSKYIPSMVTQMISVGEQTGSLDTMLSKIADFYEDEVETTAEALTSLIEPLLMVFLGGIIAVLVIAMYLPIFNLASAVGG
jgi:type IV pilus assembly protein PilC